MVWDSHPLALGATPLQTYIDGIPQIATPHGSLKPKAFQHPPPTPNFDEEAAEALKYDGLPPLAGKAAPGKVVVFTNLSSVFMRNKDEIRQMFLATDVASRGTAVVEEGALTCYGSELECPSVQLVDASEWVNLQGGSLS